MKDLAILLLAPKPISEQGDDEYKSYISSLIEAREVKSDITARVSERGTFIVSTRRKPKWVTRAEIDAFAVQCSRPTNEVWNYFKKKNYLICATKGEGTKATEASAELAEVWPE